MKFNLGLLLLVLLSFSACGKKDTANSEAGFSDEGSLLSNDQGAWLDGNWGAQSTTDKDFVWKITAANHTFVQEVRYQVGREGDSVVPYPTSCHYRMSGLVRVDLATQERKDYFQQNGKTTVPELVIRTTVQKYELIEDSKNDPGCAAFIHRESEQLTGGVPSHFSIEIKKDNATTFVDAWYGTTFQKK